jgi:hypothetical protein
VIVPASSTNARLAISSAIAEFDNALEHLFDNDWRKPKRRFVEHQQAGAAHQGPADGEHLLLADGQLPATLFDALLQARKEIKHQRHVLRAFPPVAGARGGAADEVLAHGETGEDPSAFNRSRSASRTLRRRPV